MRIAVVYQGIFPPVKGGSGADRRVRDITRGMASVNNEVFMFVPTWHDKGVENKDKNDFQIEYLGASLFEGIKGINRLKFWKDIEKRSIDLSLNVVLFYNPTIDCVLTMRKLRKKGILISAEFCDLVSSNKSTSFLKDPKNYLWKKGEDITPVETDINFVISEYLQRKVETSAPNTPVVKIPILVDPVLFKSNTSQGKIFKDKYHIKDNEIIIAYVGGIWYDEGVDFLIRAFHKILHEHKNVKLVIAGKLDKTPKHVDAESLVMELGISANVILTGWIGTDEVVQLFSAADVLTVPQIETNFCIAGLPTKLAEYSAMGKAIVATKVGDVPLYFTNGQNALLCNPSDVEDLSRQLDLLIKDDKLRTSLGKNANKTAHEKFDYRVNGDKISEALSKTSEQNSK